ncbi:NUDIX hydrolase [Methylobrevis pamukkalensis]|uniref:Nucleoside triphosphatase NudI n=1 Tax=Methylobrevis pamukkalensis TaxID=1439726 RepID=A0A1E3H3S0_9HYPH|nr:NUDIX domain-containing protein [Methylobrevis pamukkalensis]ODN70950.1 Nucleoside triphosphatase NudI [Methylobrevis pamukkalensis]
MTDIRRPTLGVSAGIWNDGGRLLLIRRAKAPFVGSWSFPGGHVDAGETLAEAARREVREECGIEIEVAGAPILREIIEHDADGTLARHYVIAVFAARPTSAATPVAGDDADDIAWIDPAEIGRLRYTPGLRRYIAATRELVLSPAGAGALSAGQEL